MLLGVYLTPVTDKLLLGVQVSLKDELMLCCAEGRKAEERFLSLLLKPSLSALLPHKQLVSGL